MNFLNFVKVHLDLWKEEWEKRLRDRDFSVDRTLAVSQVLEVPIWKFLSTLAVPTVQAGRIYHLYHLDKKTEAPILFCAEGDTADMQESKDWTRPSE